MAQNKVLNFGTGTAGVALTTTTTTNILNPGTTTGGTNIGGTQNLYLIVTHIRITNQSTVAGQVSLWKGATGTNVTGNAFAFPGIASAGALTNGVALAANSWVEWTGRERFSTGQFLVGGYRDAAANAIAIEVEGEIGIE